MLENKTIAIVGGGHAGLEAAFAVSRLGGKVVVITLDKNSIGRLSCNPAVGGLAKSHLVYEIDALGGAMPVASDMSALQYKTLNKTKGRAVWSTRVQVDKKKYPKLIQKAIKNTQTITIIEGEVVSFETKKNKIVSAVLRNDEKINCSSLIVTCGTFMNGLIHIGNKSFNAGRMGEKNSTGLTEHLVERGLKSFRLKTGTPPRISKKSLDFNFIETAPGDKTYTTLSIMTKTKIKDQEDCYLVNTNEKVHEIIKKNINTSPMFSGKIKSTGPRYCPSVEDKIYRFSERNSHHLFIEPEWRGSDQMYLNGFSTSLPEKIQIESLKQINGFENVRLIRPGYAIEYDFFPPRQLKSTLESKYICGLFFAGQINGTSGYEEAAAQGLVAGLNAFNYTVGKSGYVFSRTNSYIGVMIDDLVTSFLDEPYRMFTSRAEHRLFLRGDNCYSRLSKTAQTLGLLTEEQKKEHFSYLQLKEDIYKKINSTSVVFDKKKHKLSELIKRPEVFLSSFMNVSDFNQRNAKRAFFENETTFKYAGYITNEIERIEKNKKLENLKIPSNINYDKISGLSSESKERLKQVGPETLGQASRIYGIRPTDITLIGVHVSSLLVSRET